MSQAQPHRVVPPAHSGVGPCRAGRLPPSTWPRSAAAALPGHCARPRPTMLQCGRSGHSSPSVWPGRPRPPRTDGRARSRSAGHARHRLDDAHEPRAGRARRSQPPRGRSRPRCGPVRRACRALAPQRSLANLTRQIRRIGNLPLVVRSQQVVRFRKPVLLLEQLQGLFQDRGCAVAQLDRLPQMSDRAGGISFQQVDLGLPARKVAAVRPSDSGSADRLAGCGEPALVAPLCLFDLL